MDKAQVLVVEDESIVSAVIQDTLLNLGYDVPAAVFTGKEAVKKTQELRPDLVLMDIGLNGSMDGIQAAEEILKRFNIPVIYLTAYADKKTLQRAKITEPFGYILKPFEERELHTNIEIALYKHKVELALKESEKFSSSLLRNSSNPIIVINPDTSIRYVNSALEVLTGFSSAELIGRKIPFPWWPAKALQSREYEKAMFEGLQEVEAYFQKKNGERFWVEITSAAISGDAQPNYYLENWVDITERKRVAEEIEKSLKEKEVLLKEIHHRVKNNFQIVSGLLKLQTRYIKDRQALELFKDCQNRIKSMALIHEKLYQASDLARIDFGGYIQDLSNHLFRSYRIDPEMVKLKIDIAGGFLEVNTAIPCGLIINELVSNSLIHAFPEGRQGMINIDLRQHKGNEFILIVSDNGIGFPKELDFRNLDTLGFKLILTLVNQFEGKIELDRTAGTAFKINFKKQMQKRKQVRE